MSQHNVQCLLNRYITDTKNKEILHTPLPRHFHIEIKHCKNDLHSQPFFSKNKEVESIILISPEKLSGMYKNFLYSAFCFEGRLVILSSFSIAYFCSLDFFFEGGGEILVHREST